MNQQVHFITRGVADLAAAQAFYLDGLGWEPLGIFPGEVFFIQVGPGLVFSCFEIDQFKADVGEAAPIEGTPFLTLSHNVATEAEVAEVLAVVEGAGGTVVKPAQRAAFGGFHGHFTDPSGLLWEVCHNPGWSVAPDGTVTIEAIEPGGDA